MGFFTKLLSMGEDKPLKNYQKVVEGLNALEAIDGGEERRGASRI